MKKIRSNLLLAFISTAIFFTLLEALLSIFWGHKITERPFLHERYHPVFGWENSPNAEGMYELPPNISFYRHHNGKGIRSLREFPYEKPPGVKRILLIGDSFFWGYGVNDGDVVSEVLQEETGNKAEVINGAVAGYGTDQELLWLSEEGLKYSPDLVVLGFFVANDFEDIARSMSYSYPHYPKPYFSLQNGRLILQNVPVPDTTAIRKRIFNEPDTIFGKLKKYLRHHTYTYPFITQRLNSIPALRSFFISIGIAENNAGNFDISGVPDVVTPVDRVLPLFEALVAEEERICSEAGADFLFVFIPEKENPAGMAPLYNDAPGWVNGRNTETSRFFKKFTAKEKIKYLDLLPAFREKQARGDTLYIQGDHHWSAEGHRAAAAALYEWLEDNGYVSRK